MQERSMKLASRYEDEACQRLLMRLINNLQYEQTGKAIMDSIVMTDFSAKQFFEYVDSDWDLEDKLLTIHKTKMITDVTKTTTQLEENGFVGLNEKFMCMGCGGIVLEIPDFCTMATVHAWLNPVCPAFLGEEPDITKGMEIIEWPEIKHPVVQKRLEKLQESSFICYNKKYSQKEERTKTWEENQDLIPSLKAEQLAEAGWYVEPHISGPTVRCFCCGIEMRNWGRDDCPMMVHVVASPVCPYMHAIMDEEDIKAIFTGHAQEVRLNNTTVPAVNQYFQKIWFTHKWLVMKG